MHKIWVVMRHEYWHHVRRRGFLFATFGMPLVFVALLVLIVVLSYFSGQVATIGYVDQAGLFQDVDPAIVYEATQMVRYADVASAQQAVLERQADVAFLIPADYLAAGQIDVYVLEVLPALAESRFYQFVQIGVARQIIKTEDDTQVLQPITKLNSVVLDAPPEAGTSLALSSVLPVLFGIGLLGSTFAAGSYLMLAVTEEKEQRIMEILASSLSPYQMMAGKIIGLGALGLTQLLVWTGGGACILIWGLTRFNLLSGQTRLGTILLLGLILYLPAYILIAATLSAIGAAVSSSQEGQQLTGVVTMLSTLPLWFFTVLTEHPHGILALSLTIFPFTAPVTLLQRVAVADVPQWQIIGTIIWLWLCAAGMIWVAGRVVRLGLLRYGKRVSLRELGQIFLKQ